jgi:hypothetical protein
VAAEMSGESASAIASAYNAASGSRSSAGAFGRLRAAQPDNREPGSLPEHIGKASVSIVPRTEYYRFRCGRNLSNPHIRGVKNLIVLVDKLDEGFARVDFRIDGDLREIKIFGHEKLVTCRRAVGDAI